ncbi:MAG: hypothetical protein M3Q65_05820 [Chloroflexota bacterium]|nr:hypothetical protein [Chloroflexota bacterium]
MVGLLPVIAMFAVFIGLGLSAREFDGATKRRLLVLIAAIILLTLFVGPALEGPVPSLDDN